MMTSQRHTQLFLLLSPVLLCAGSRAQGQANDIALAESYPAERLQQILIPPGQWRPFPAISNRKAWNSIPSAVKHHVIQNAEAVAERGVVALPASVYLQYQRSGNRSNYQDIWYERRERLHTLVAAECLENQGRFLDPITDLIWALCEETSWTWPAHIHPQQAGVGLPEADDQVVALFSAQTANTLALTHALLAEKLDTVSPLIGKRIHREIDRRILTPFMDKEFGWMGYADRRNQSYPNNWNPWICSNVLLAALLCESDAPRRAHIVNRVLDCLDNFLTYYPYDGSCDEGPSYWGRAGASLFDALEHLYSATHKQFDLYPHPLIQEIARFPYRVHIADDYFVCLGDCDARFTIDHELASRFGTRIDDAHLRALGAYGVTDETLLANLAQSSDLNRFLHLLFNGPGLAQIKQPTPPLLRDVWLSHPDMQMMAVRDQEGSTRGLYVAAWGGHNAQSHNHNDVGNFVIYADGQPVVIDVGRPTYRKQTFSRRRYEIWAFQSGFHNLPTINGIDQKEGRAFAARDVHYQRTTAGAQLDLDLRDAYPRSAEVTSWKRSISLNRSEGVTVADVFVLEEPSPEVVENLIVAGRVTHAGPGRLVLHDRTEVIQLLLEFDAAKLSPEIERLSIVDDKLLRIWGDRLYRIRLKTTHSRKQDRLELRFSKLQ